MRAQTIWRTFKENVSKRATGWNREPDRTASLPISLKPIAVRYTAGSVLPDPGEPPLFIGERSRFGTCSGVAWFDDEYLATVNLLGNALRTYRYDASAGELVPIQKLVDLQGLARPENLAVSRAGNLLAITNSTDGTVNLYPVDPATRLVSTAPTSSIQCAGDINTHGVAFSPCSRFLAFTVIDSPGWIRLFEISPLEGGRFVPRPLQELRNELLPLKPKGIDFSPDGRFVAVSYAANCSREKTSLSGQVCVYPFQKRAGLGRRAISTCATGLDLKFPDDVKFFPDGSRLIIPSQGDDSASIVSFNVSSGKLGRRIITLKNPDADLSFPHGVGVSTGGQYLGITSYGDDKVSIYSVH